MCSDWPGKTSRRCTPRRERLGFRGICIFNLSKCCQIAVQNGASAYAPSTSVPAPHPHTHPTQPSIDNYTKFSFHFFHFRWFTTSLRMFVWPHFPFILFLPHFSVGDPISFCWGASVSGYWPLAGSPTHVCTSPQSVAVSCVCAILCWANILTLIYFCFMYLYAFYILLVFLKVFPSTGSQRFL